MYGLCLDAHWSRTGVSVGLSSTEAELNASAKAACKALGMKQICEHMKDFYTSGNCGEEFAMFGDVLRMVILLTKTSVYVSRACCFDVHAF